MTKTFFKKAELPVTSFDWGDNILRLEPTQSGCTSMVVMDVTLEPGGMHNFHKHPDQDEIIIIVSGRVIQYVHDQKQELSAGDSAYVPRDTVHASFNDFDEPVTLQVVLAPASGPTGYELVDVAHVAPWNTLRS